MKFMDCGSICWVSPESPRCYVLTSALTSRPSLCACENNGQPCIILAHVIHFANTQLIFVLEHLLCFPGQ
ncbi:Arylsulfatase [Fusarium oxysporum f. sp. albedinis]|nr:Arylsulfatase [Fusarium oxysporum f. sp. albedinis]